MGSPGIFLKKRQEIEYPQIVEEIVSILNKIGYICYCEQDQFTFSKINFDFSIITVLEKKNSEKQFLMYVHGQEDEIHGSTFDWIRKGGCLNPVINIEDFYECEDMLLRFAYEYLNKFPNDIFWDDVDWYYTKADIEKIVSRPYDKDWCYKNPKDCF